MQVPGQAPEQVLASGPQKPHIILASTSPRRQALLSEACAASNLTFSTVDPCLDDGELTPGKVDPATYCTALAYFKACAGAGRLSPEQTQGRVIIGADTICLHQNEIIGKPRDAAAARATIERFMNDEHDVLTGVAILEGPRRELFFDRATVHLGTVDAASLDAYLDAGDWQGKAGAYNLFERLEAGWPLTYQGDPTTIVGLPMAILTERLGLHPVNTIGGTP